MLQKIFPSGVGNSPVHSFNLILVAEGFRAAELTAFSAACTELVERVLLVPPFNLTRTHPYWISIYRLLTPSANAGPANGAASAGRSAFESAIIGAGVLTLNPVRVTAVLDAEQFSVGGQAVPFGDLVSKGPLAIGGPNSLIVFLIP